MFVFYNKINYKGALKMKNLSGYIIIHLIFIFLLNVSPAYAEKLQSFFEKETNQKTIKQLQKENMELQEKLQNISRSCNAYKSKIHEINKMAFEAIVIHKSPSMTIKMINDNTDLYLRSTYFTCN